MSACFIIGYSACSGKRKTFPDLRFRGDCALCYCDKIFNAVVGLKNTQYQRAAINRARFLLSEEILLGINEVMNEQEMNLGGIYRMEFLDDLVRIYSSSVMDGNFLYSTTKGCREFAPQDLVTICAKGRSSIRWALLNTATFPEPPIFVVHMPAAMADSRG